MRIIMPEIFGICSHPGPGFTRLSQVSKPHKTRATTVHEAYWRIPRTRANRPARGSPWRLREVVAWLESRPPARDSARQPRSCFQRESDRRPGAEHHD